MQIFIYIIGAYVVYFLGNIIYDGFIAKPKVVKSEDGAEPTFVLEDQILENTENEESQLVNFDAVEQFENDDKVVFDELHEKTDEEINLEFEKKLQEEQYLENLEKDEAIASVLDDENNVSDSEQSFIASFKKYLKGDNITEKSSEIIQEDFDVLSFLNNPTKITSFDYANAQLFY